MFHLHQDDGHGNQTLDSGSGPIEAMHIPIGLCSFPHGPCDPKMVGWESLWSYNP